MQIEIRDGFRLVKENDNIALLVDSDRLKEYLEYAKASNIRALSLQEYHGYKLQDINFLIEYDFFTSLTVIKYLHEIDIKAIHHLRHLKWMRISNEKQPVDFSFFPELTDASFDWNEKLINLNKCSLLKNLAVWKYKPKSKSFVELNGLRQLEYLHLTQSNIETFKGLNELASLHKLEMYYLPRLSTLDGLEAVAGHLKIMQLSSCKKLIGYENVLGKLSKLEKLILSDCGALENIDFVKKLNKLSFFSFVGTNVKNGDMHSLINSHLEYVGFDDKKHYTHKMKEVNLRQ